MTDMTIGREQAALWVANNCNDPTIEAILHDALSAQANPFIAAELAVYKDEHDELRRVSGCPDSIGLLAWVGGRFTQTVATEAP